MDNKIESEVPFIGTNEETMDDIDNKIEAEVEPVPPIVVSFTREEKTPKLLKLQKPEPLEIRLKPSPKSLEPQESPESK